MKQDNQIDSVGNSESKFNLCIDFGTDKIDKKVFQL